MQQADICEQHAIYDMCKRIKVEEYTTGNCQWHQSEVTFYFHCSDWPFLFFWHLRQYRMPVRYRRWGWDWQDCEMIIGYRMRRWKLFFLFFHQPRNRQNLIFVFKETIRQLFASSGWLIVFALVKSLNLFFCFVPCPTTQKCNKKFVFIWNSTSPLLK